MSEWQDISSAPKDGTWFLAYNPNSSMAWAPYQFCSWRTDYTGKGYFAEEDTSEETEATHWQPLPAPPSTDPGIPVYRMPDGTDEALKGE